MAANFFVVPTATYRLLFVLVILATNDDASCMSRSQARSARAFQNLQLVSEGEKLEVRAPPASEPGNGATGRRRQRWACRPKAIRR